jgi:hypothetical protein
MARLRLRPIPVPGIGVWARGSLALGRRPRRSLRAGGTLPAGAVLTGLALLGASVPASAQALTWSVVPSPNPGTSSNGLSGVSCVSAAACTAVGSYGSSGGGNTLVESWNGTSWSVVPSPNPAGSESAGLAAVSCVSTAACTAVGGYYDSSGDPRTLVESWNGTGWSVVPSPNPGSGGNTLSGVSCVSAAACTAVGTRADNTDLVPKTLIESWNGTRWSVVPSPNRGSDGDPLSGVSCVSATACTAVGTKSSGVNFVSRTLIESWNGTSWSVVPSPNPGSRDVFGGVSCASAAACTAAGYYAVGGGHKTLIEAWNGTSWSVVPSPNVVPNDYLDSVSCASAAVCTAAGLSFISGKFKTLIESWNGASWSVVPSPSPPANDHLDGVSCASAAACTAVGLYLSGRRTLIESGTASG